MSLSLTAEFLKMLADKFGIVITDPNELIMNGSAVNDATLKANMASAASSGTGAADIGTTGSSSGTNPFSTYGPLAVQGAEMYGQHVASTEAKAAQALQLKQSQAGIDATNAAASRNETTSAQGQITQLKAYLNNDPVELAAFRTQEQTALDQGQTVEQEATALDNRITLANTPNGEKLTDWQISQLKNQETQLWNQDKTFEDQADGVDKQIDALTAKMTDQESDLAKLGGTWTPPNPTDAGGGEVDESEWLDGVAPPQPVDWNANFGSGTADPIINPPPPTVNLPTPAMPQLPAYIPPPVQHWGIGDYIKVGTAALSAFGLFESVKSLAGHFNVGGLFGAGASAFGIWKSLSGIHSMFEGATAYLNGMPMLQHLMSFFTSAPGIAIIIGIIVLIALLMGITKNTTPAASELPVVNMPTVWTSGAAYFIGVGAALAVAGVGLTQNAPMMQTLSMPTITITNALNSASLTDTSGNAIGANAYSLAGSVFVNQPTNQVVYVTPGGNGESTVHVVTLKSGLQFAAPAGPTDAYINFFGSNGQPNPDAVAGLQNSASLASAAPLLGASGPTAMQVSGSGDKSVKTNGTVTSH